MDNPKCDCTHFKNVHASFDGHPTHCTMILEPHNTQCPCKEFMKLKDA